MEDLFGIVATFVDSLVVDSRAVESLGAASRAIGSLPVDSLTAGSFGVDSLAVDAVTLFSGASFLATRSSLFPAGPSATGAGAGTGAGFTTSIVGVGAAFCPTSARSRFARNCLSAASAGVTSAPQATRTDIATADTKTMERVL